MQLAKIKLHIVLALDGSYGIKFSSRETSYVNEGKNSREWVQEAHFQVRALLRRIDFKHVLNIFYIRDLDSSGNFTYL